MSHEDGEVKVGQENVEVGLESLPFSGLVIERLPPAVYNADLDFVGETEQLTIGGQAVGALDVALQVRDVAIAAFSRDRFLNAVLDHGLEHPIPDVLEIVRDLFPNRPGFSVVDT